ncbi:MAG: helix-turn-helix transcriptional regulator [Bacteroidetes bacterium]|nr:helix-turn-helix transcriptional regulator [Bacteroidota bacterium]
MEKRLQKEYGKCPAYSQNIKKARNKLGLTQDDLVRKSGVKHTTLTKIESNVVIKPSVQTVAKIAKALGVPMEDLVK